VLFVFVIMLLNLRHDIDDGLTHTARRVLGWFFALVLAAVFELMLRRPWGLGPPGLDAPEVVATVGNTKAIGLRLYTDYLFPFEVTSLILLVGIIGAVVLAKRRGDLLASPVEPMAPRAAATATGGARPASSAGATAPANPNATEPRPEGT